MKRLIGWLREMLWPRGLICLTCPEHSGGNLLCADCARELDALRLDDPDDDGNPARRSVWRYAGCASTLILRLKLQCLADAAEVLADGMADVLREMPLPPDTVLTWVSMPKARLRARGIDHGRVLCEAVGRRCGLPVRQLLTRTRRVHTQRGLNRTQRLANLQGTFAATETLAVPVLLIDDVMTTGATAQACRDVLIKAGAPDVYVLTAARVPRG